VRKEKSLGPHSGAWLSGSIVGGFSGLIVLLFALSAEPARAGGIGGSFTYGHAEGRLEDRDDVWADLDTETDVAGFGVAFDTNLAQDRLINYRLVASLEFAEQEVEQAGLQNEVQGSSFSLDQTLGFGILRTPELRVFLGPSLHLGVGSIDDHINVEGFRADYEEIAFTAGLGPELGINFNIGRHLTLSTSTFVRYGIRVQDFDGFYDDAGSDGVFGGDEIQAGIRTAIFFRFGRDAYDPRDAYGDDRHDDPGPHGRNGRYRRY
jgi:hypothetical protein